MAPKDSMQLPLQVTSPVDIGRLQRELEAIDAALTQAALRNDGVEAKLPKTTNLMDQILQGNKINLADAAQRNL